MARRSSPAATRNREPILGVLRDVLPTSGTVLEVASGTGEHAVYFAASLPGLVWQPTDPDPDALASIEAWRTSEGLPNVRPACLLDTRREPWPIGPVDAVVCINMVHISPWEATEALFAGAAERLPAEAPLVLYGPYKIDGKHTALSNESFDASLRQRNPAWGVRELEAVVELAGRSGFDLRARVAMPANNFTIAFRRRA